MDLLRLESELSENVIGPIGVEDAHVRVVLVEVADPHTGRLELVHDWIYHDWLLRTGRGPQPELTERTGLDEQATVGRQIPVELILDRRCAAQLQAVLLLKQGTTEDWHGHGDLAARRYLRGQAPAVGLQTAFLATGLQFDAAYFALRLLLEKVVGFVDFFSFLVVKHA